MKKYIIKMLIVLIFCCPFYVMADEVNPLELAVNTSYPVTVTTVGQALLYVLAVTDYKLAIGYPASDTAYEIIARPIPPEAIQDSVMPIYQAILLLIGQDSKLVVDTKHKLVTVERTFFKGAYS